MERDDFRGVPSPTLEDIRIYDSILKKLLKCKSIALVFCIIGTVVLLLLPLDFLSSTFLAIILPSFLTGYIVVNVAGILTGCRGHIDLLADICFSSCGTLVNTFCGIYMMYYWIEWITNTFESGNGFEGASFLILSVSCFLNMMIMGAQLIFSIIEIKRRGLGDDGDDNDDR